MNNNEIIEEAAKNHMLKQFYSDDNDWGEFPCCIDDIEKQCVGDFKAGVEWLRENLEILVDDSENEYIRGDLVELDGELKVVLVPEPSNFIVSEISNRGKTTLCNISDIKPIPLTPQILENNGWTISNGGCLCIDKGSFYDHNIATKKEDLSVSLFYLVASPKKFTFRECEEYGTAYNEIEYVHQLQHLLFGLGLDSKIKV